jgi:hypothetical protein
MIIEGVLISIGGGFSGSATSRCETPQKKEAIQTEGRLLSAQTSVYTFIGGDA